MNRNQKWKKELSEFFVKDENWDIACDTVDAVECVEKYWKELFWDTVYQVACEKLDDELWDVRLEGEEVDIHPKYNKHQIEENFCIMIACDEEDGCWYGIWLGDEWKKSDRKKIAEFSMGEGLAEGEETFYRPQAFPYLDKAQLGRVAKNNFEGAQKLAYKTLSFIKESQVNDMILGLRK